MSRRLTFAIAAILGSALAAHVWAQPSWVQPPGKGSARFQGYWMGVDPVDGGDARRSLVRQPNGTYSMAARDSVLTLCDGTDRGFASFDDGVALGPNVMQSNALTIQCFNNGASVVLHVRYELLAAGLMLEHTTRQDGTVVGTIVLHRVSGG
jgi:hypothetical protein